MVRRQFFITEEQDKRLNCAAKDSTQYHGKKVTRADIVREALEFYLDNFFDPCEEDEEK